MRKGRRFRGESRRPPGASVDDTTLFSERTRRRRQSAGRWPGGGSRGRIRGRHFQEPIEAGAGIGKPERAPTPSGAAGVVIVRKGGAQGHRRDAGRNGAAQPPP